MGSAPFCVGFAAHASEHGLGSKRLRPLKLPDISQPRMGSLPTCEAYYRRGFLDSVDSLATLKSASTVATLVCDFLESACAPVKMFCPRSHPSHMTVFGLIFKIDTFIMLRLHVEPHEAVGGVSEVRTFQDM